MPISVLITFAILIIRIEASPIYDIENLDDLCQAYYNGEIDYGTFIILSDAYDIGGLSLADLEALGIIERNALPLLSGPQGQGLFSVNFLSDAKSKIGYRRYSCKFEDITGSYYLDFRSKHLNSDFEIKDYNRDYSWSRRSISYCSERLELKLGDYTVTEGEGLVIGRFDYRPSSGYANDDNLNFVYPDNSYYNGLSLAYINKTGGRLYYSRKKYGDAAKDFAGAAVEYSYPRLNISFLAGLNRFSHDNALEQRLALGLNIKYASPDYAASAEYANQKNADAIYLRVDKLYAKFKYYAEFWSYGKGFENYNCSGPAATDYQTFYSEDTTLGFRSAQAGETGMTINYLQDDLSAGLMCWSNQTDDRLNVDIHMSSDNSLSDKLHLLVQISANERETSRCLWTKAGLYSDYILAREAGIKLYFAENNGVVHDNSYAYIYLDEALTGNMILFCRFRPYFNGDFRWYAGERFLSKNGVGFNAEVSYGNGFNINFRIEKSL